MCFLHWLILNLLASTNEINRIGLTTSYGFIGSEGSWSFLDGGVSYFDRVFVFFPMIQIQCHVHVISNISSKTNIVAFLGSHILNLTWCLGFFITKFWETMILAVGGCGSCLILQEWGCPMLVLSIHVRWWHYDLLRLADGILWLYWLNCHARCSWLCTDPETHHTAFKFPFVKLWQIEVFNFSSLNSATTDMKLCARLLETVLHLLGVHIHTTTIIGTDRLQDTSMFSSTF